LPSLVVLTNASSTNLSAYTAYFGGSATSSFSSTGALTLATALTGTNGGTGVNNGANTITLGGNINTANSFTTAGNNALTLTTGGVTNSTLPSGTHTLAATDVAQAYSQLQQFAAAASSTLLSIYKLLYVGGTATTTIQGDTTGTSTFQGFVNVAGTNSTSTFSGNLAAATTSVANLLVTNNSTSTFNAGLNTGLLNVTSTTATSTFANGLQINTGCILVQGTCIAGNALGISLTQTVTATTGTNVSWTPPSNTAYIVVSVWGSGGGGSGGGDNSNNNGGSGGNGNASCFGTNATACTSPLVQGGAGSGAPFGGTGDTGSGIGGGGIGGAAGSGSGSGANITMTGTAGTNGLEGTGAVLSGHAGTGGSAPGGGGGGGAGGSGAANGTVGAAYGGGGGGGGGSGGGGSGAGGGSGGYAQETIANPSGTYFYTIGAGGTAGTAGGTAGTGGAGGVGGITISVYTFNSYNNNGAGVVLSKVTSVSSAQTNTAFTPQNNDAYMIVDLWGSGGGGGGDGSSFGGGGGGGGGYAQKTISTPAGTYYYTLGTGGSGGTNADGSDGGQSCFSNSSTSTACSGVTGPIMTANGGTKGLNNGNGSGSGGTASGGDINLTGQGGGPGNSSQAAGTGGSAPRGGGGGKGGSDASGAQSTGGAGAAPGGGGGGAGLNTSTAAGAGGAGGIVIYEYTTSASLTSGTAGQFAFYNVTGNVLSATSSIFANTTNSFIGIGTASPNARLTVSNNAGTPTTTIPAATVGYFASADNANTFLTLDAYGSQHSDLLLRQARGTMAAPTASQANDVIGQIQARGYGASGFASGARASMQLNAAENWTDAAQGTYMTFSVTPKLSTTLTEAMRIDSTGNIGIGTTSPAAKLGINTGGTNGVIIGQVSDATTYGVLSFNSVTAAASHLGIAGGGGTDKALYVDAPSGGTINLRIAASTELIVDSSGNVGIATSSPNTNLTVTAPSGNIAKSVVAINSQFLGTAVNSNSNPAVYWSSGNDLRFGTSSEQSANTTFTELLRISGTNGDVGIGSTTPSVPLTVTSASNLVGEFDSGGSIGQFKLNQTAGNAYSFVWARSSANKWYLQNTAADNLSLFNSDANSNANILTITQAGSVGIGSSTPTQALDVKGNINVSGCFMVNEVCIGYIQKLVGIYTNTTATTNGTVTFGTAASAPGSFTGNLVLPATTTQIMTEVWGAGGSGGGGNGASARGVGGGGGGYSEKIWSTVGTKYFYNVGTPGTSAAQAANGTAGTASSFGNGTTATSTANGGSGGTAAGGGALAGVGGGTASGGDVNITGGDSPTLNLATDASPGGNSPRGGAGGATNVGAAGQTPGGGGANGNFTGTNSGGGGNGEVIITVYATSSPTLGGNDYAEMYPVSNPNINAGNIVAVDFGAPVSMKLAIAGDGAPLAGIISTEPGQLLGDQGAAGQRPVAFSGRVPAKVNLEGGPIKIGDRIAVSSVPGVGKKAGPFDNSVGIAIDNYDGSTGTLQADGSTQGTVTVFIDLEQGININAIALGLLGPSNPIFAAASASSSTSTSASSTAVISIPLDFVGGVMSAISERINGLNYVAPSSNATSSVATSTDSTAATSTNPIDEYASGLLQSIFRQITSWFANAANGIGDFFANRVYTKQLCVQDDSGSSTCITKGQLDSLLAGAAGSGSSHRAAGPPSGGGTNASSTAPTDPGAGSNAPVISINGNDPATLNIGDTYVDLGATITDPQADLNLGIAASVDGGATTTLDKIQIDTSQSGTHTILYSATDQGGNIGTATRTVVVSNPTPSGGSGSNDASSTAPTSSDAGSSSATSTDASSTTP